LQRALLASFAEAEGWRAVDSLELGHIPADEEHWVLAKAASKENEADLLVVGKILVNSSAAVSIAAPSQLYERLNWEAWDESVCLEESLVALQ
jgi:hypothetical protein